MSNSLFDARNKFVRVEAQDLLKRIDWLEQKLAAMREPGNPDYTPSQLLWGRVQGQIGELKHLLEQQP